MCMYTYNIYSMMMALCMLNPTLFFCSGGRYWLARHSRVSALRGVSLLFVVLGGGLLFVVIGVGGGREVNYTLVCTSRRGTLACRRCGACRCCLMC